MAASGERGQCITSTLFGQILLVSLQGGSKMYLGLSPRGAPVRLWIGTRPDCMPARSTRTAFATLKRDPRATGFDTLPIGARTLALADSRGWHTTKPFHTHA